MKSLYITLKKSLYNRPLLLGLAIFSFLSCDNFTEVEMPQSQLTGPAVFTDFATANAALADIYARMREGGVASGASLQGTSLMANYADDMDYYGSNTSLEQFSTHTIIPSNASILRLWNTTYAQIYAINALIEGINATSSITGEERNRLLGEALFLRAFNHFYLVNLFGDVPYVTATNYQSNARIQKLSEAQVWEQIISDLTHAEALLPDDYATSERVRVNRSTCTAMLARVYLFTEDYEQAKIRATAVIENDIYSVEPNPALLFLKNSPSIIWAFHPGVAGLNTKDANLLHFTSGPPTKPSLSASLYQSFEPGDVRKDLWVSVITNSSGTWYKPFKYKKPFATPISEEYTIVMRIEEQYLIRAEASARLGDYIGAQQDLNIIRNRVGLPDVIAATEADLLPAILKERRSEFFTEQSHRWLDLKRTGNAETVLSAVKPGWQNRDVLLPLPEAELLLNENLLPQNIGY